MIRYDIAGLIIDFYPALADTPAEFASYSSTIKGVPNSEVSFQGCSKIIEPKGKFLYKDYISWYTNSEDEMGFSACIPSLQNPAEIICKLTTDQDWRHVSISYLKDIPGIEDFVTRFVGNIIMRNLILVHEGIILHASSVKWIGKGIIFTAPSGTGKSTQARLWETYMGADVLNDDAPALKISNKQITVHGTPWCGSHSKHMNTCAPLAAIFVLEQNKENRIRRLTQRELTSRLLPRFLLPYHDPHFMDIALQHFAGITASTPVYLLQCRPDREAVELVYSCLASSP